MIYISKGFKYQIEQFRFGRLIILHNISRFLVFFLIVHLIAFGHAGVFDVAVFKRGVVAALKTNLCHHALQSRLTAIVINVYITKSAMLRTVTSTHYYVNNNVAEVFRMGATSSALDMWMSQSA
jgi:hypothetical protein